MAKKIPLRPDSHFNYNLNNDEMDCITWVVLAGRDRVDSWVKFVLPNAKDVKQDRVTIIANDWWKLPNVKRYIADYKETLDVALNNPKKTVLRDREKETEEALNTFRDNVIDAVNNPTSDIESLKDQGQLMKAIGMLKEEEEEVLVLPQRYLPEKCSTCRYKQFIDEQVALGNIVDE